jgi:hypothetical protein
MTDLQEVPSEKKETPLDVFFATAYIVGIAALLITLLAGGSSIQEAFQAWFGDVYGRIAAGVLYLIGATCTTYIWCRSKYKRSGGATLLLAYAGTFAVIGLSKLLNGPL